MRMRGKNLCILAMILLISTIVLTCSTAPAKTEVVDPSLTIPYFPAPFDSEGKAIPVLVGQNVTVPLWYWIKITEYVVDVEKTREVYEAWQKIYLTGNTDGTEKRGR